MNVLVGVFTTSQVARGWNLPLTMAVLDHEENKGR